MRPTNGTVRGSTGRRPAASIERTAWPSTAAGPPGDDESPGATQATGCPQNSSTADPNVPAVDADANKTLADGPIDVHNDETAVNDPPYVAEAPAPRSRTRLTSFETPDEYRPTDGLAVSPGFSVVTSGGMAMASTQQAPASTTAAREAPSTEARDVSHDDAHTASSTSPGSATAASRCDPSGCHGTTAGSHNTAATDQKMTRSGSTHNTAARQATAERPSSTASTVRRPSTAAPAQASSTAGTPRYHTTQ